MYIFYFILVHKIGKIPKKNNTRGCLNIDYLKININNDELSKVNDKQDKDKRFNP